VLQPLDAYDMLEPRDILPELRKDFWEGLASAKWSERRDALLVLRDLASYPRLAPGGDWGDVNRELRKVCEYAGGQLHLPPSDKRTVDYLHL